MSPMTDTTMPMAKAINTGLRAAMQRDPKVMLMGEDIGPLGGVFRITDGLQKEFGDERVVDTPLAESGIVGTAVGLAMAGYRPVCEIQFDGFVFPSYNQITTQLAKMSYRTQGSLPMPVVIRIPYGGHIGAIEHHSESPEALFAHTPGLRIVSPATASDGYTMIQQAIASPDPVIFLEPKSRYWEKGPVTVPADGGQHGEVDTYSLHHARTITNGADLTLATYGPGVKVSLQAAETAREAGTQVEVIDLRSISPLDIATVQNSVERTGRLVIVHEAPTVFGPGAELAAAITERCFYSLQAPVLRVGGYHTPYPASTHEDYYLPSLDRILDAVERSMRY